MLDVLSTFVNRAWRSQGFRPFPVQAGAKAMVSQILACLPCTWLLSGPSLASPLQGGSFSIEFSEPCFRKQFLYLVWSFVVGTFSPCRWRLRGALVSVVR